MNPGLSQAMVTAALLAASMAACSVYVKKNADDPAGPTDGDQVVVIPPDHTPPMPLQSPEDGEDCQSGSESWATWSSGYYSSYYGASWRQCRETEDYRWRTSCPDAGCRSVPVFVHYMLSEELGDGVTVHVEAFDNQHFNGYPKASVEVRNFRARTGEWQEAGLFLMPGEYYLRAFLRTDEADPAPYMFDGMQLVASEPVGIYGALSGPEALSVSPNGTPNPVHIKLDRLFHRPGSEPDSKAHLRALLTVAPEHQAAIAAHRKLVITLSRSEDPGVAPVATYELASELLKVEGDVGRAEFVSPSLAPGRYIVRALLDADGDTFQDPGELAGLYQELGAPKLVEISRDRITTIALPLTPAPAAP